MRARHTWVVVAAIALAGCTHHVGGGSGGTGSAPTPRPDPARAMVERNLGLAALENTDNAGAAAHFHSVQRYAPDDPLGYIDEALALERPVPPGGSLPARAIEDVNKAVTLAGSSAAVQLLAGQILAVDPAHLTQAEQHVDQSLKMDPNNIQAQWEWYRERTGGGVDLMAPTPPGGLDHLRVIHTLAPGNLAAAMNLAGAYLQAHQPAQALPYIQQWQAELWGTGPEVSNQINALITRVRAGDAAGALSAFRIAGNVTKPGDAYQAAMIELYPGVQGLPLTRLKGERPPDSPIGPSIAVSFTDAAASLGLANAGGSAGVSSIALGVLSAGAYSPTPVAGGLAGAFPPPDLVVVDRAGHVHVWRNNGGHYTASPTPFPPGAPVSSVLLADFEAPGGAKQVHQELHLLDPLLLRPGGATYLYRPDASRFVDKTAAVGLTGLKATIATAFDFNHDGNLDIVAGGASPGLQLFRGRSDGDFETGTAAAGTTNNDGRKLPGYQVGTSQILQQPFKGIASGFAFGDFDGDGATDLYVANRAGAGVLYHNARQGWMSDSTIQAGLAGLPRSSSVAAADWDNDGALDLAIGCLDGSGVHLMHNRGRGAFAAATSPDVARRTRGYKINSLCFLDYDNDGLQDLAVGISSLHGAVPASGLLLFHNAGGGRFTDATSILPQHLPPVTQVAPADLGDGSISLFAVTAAGKLLVLRNNGGAKNHWINLAIWGQHGSNTQKVNAEGIGAIVQLEAGAHSQYQTVTGQVTHFGLGNLAAADACRVLLTDGVPQDLPDGALKPVSNTTITEIQTLKGSCPFFYGWDGSSFRFITDGLSAAPLGLLLNASTYAPADPFDFVPVPSWVKPHNGRLSFALSEELAELTFLDSARLLAIDHPAGASLVGNESFGGMKSTLPWYLVRSLLPPKAAIDTAGNDVLSTVLHQDGVYLHDFQPGRYQGISRSPHSLTLDLGPFPHLSRLTPITLFLNGWIYWTDTTTNVKLARDPSAHPQVPSLAVPDALGRWHTVIPFIGLPGGKNKTMAVDLTGKFLCNDHRVRISTNYLIYWDYAAFRVGEAPVPYRIQEVAPCQADLHYHGFSRMTQPAAYGPTIPDYRQLLKERAWPPLPGWCTAYGDVTSLLKQSDDRWVTINSGDQCSMEFAVGPETLPGLAKGWQRDYIVKLDGWDKDNDYHTAYSGSVGPYPYHGMKGYPAAGQHYPGDREHQRFLKETLTRWVDRRPFLTDIQYRTGLNG